MISSSRARIGLALAAAIVMALLTGCGGPRFTSPPEQKGRVVEVVTSTNVWGAVAKQVGGDKVHVTVLIKDPKTDPHLYEPTAADAAAVAKAQVIVINGAGYDDFLVKLAVNATNKPKVLVAQVLMGATGKNVNPHFWYAINNMSEVANGMARYFGSIDPADAAEFEANAGNFEDSLRPVLDVTNEIRTKFKGTPVAYTERLPAYLVLSIGLKDATPLGFATAVENGTDPSPADAQAMFSLISNHKIRLLLYNTQTVSALTTDAKARATKAGIPVVGVSESMPSSAKTYADWMLRQTKEIQAALEGSR